MPKYERRRGRGTGRGGGRGTGRAGGRGSLKLKPLPKIKPRKPGEPLPEETWAVLSESYGFRGGSADTLLPLLLAEERPVAVATLDTEGNESHDWASGAAPTLVQVALESAAGPAVIIYAPFVHGKDWAAPLRALLRGATVWVWARDGDAELAWTAVLLPESHVVAQQPVDEDGEQQREQRVGLRTACTRAGLATVKSYCDWRRWVRPSHLRGRTCCDVQGWEGTDMTKLPRDLRLYAAADAALQLLLLDPSKPTAADASVEESSGAAAAGTGTGERAQRAAEEAAAMAVAEESEPEGGFSHRSSGVIEEEHPLLQEALRQKGDTQQRKRPRRRGSRVVVEELPWAWEAQQQADEPDETEAEEASELPPTKRQRSAGDDIYRSELDRSRVIEIDRASPGSDGDGHSSDGYSSCSEDEDEYEGGGEQQVRPRDL